MGGRLGRGHHACGLFPGQEPNPYPLPWSVESWPLDHQGSPKSTFYEQIITISRCHSPIFLSPCVSLFSGLIISNWSSPLTKPAVSCLYDTELMRGLGLDRGRSRKQLTGIFEGRACNHEWNHWCHHITWKLCFDYTIPLPGGPERSQDACRRQHSPLPGLQGLLSSHPILPLSSLNALFSRPVHFLNLLECSCNFPLAIYLMHGTEYMLHFYTHSVSSPFSENKYNRGLHGSLMLSPK